MFVENRYPRKKNSTPVPRSRWLAGMVAGQLLGFAVAVAVVAPVLPAAILASTLAGGVLGGIAASKLKTKPLEDRPIPVRVFQALVHTSMKLNDMILEKEFERVASGGGERDRRAMKAQPKLAVPPPAPPKFGRM